MNKTSSVQRKISRGEIMSKCSSKKMYSLFDYESQAISTKTEGGKSGNCKCFILFPGKNNFTEEESSTNATNYTVEECLSKFTKFTVEESLFKTTTFTVEESVTSATNFTVEECLSKSTKFTVEESLSKSTNFMMDESLTNATELDKTFGSYADVLAKTEKLWSPNKPALQKLCSCTSSHKVLRSNSSGNETWQELDRDFKPNSLPKKTDAEGNSMLWESAVWENLSSCPKSEDRYFTGSLFTEVKSLKPADEPESNKMSNDIIGGMTKDKDSKFLEEYVSFKNLKFLNKLLDDDSAYGSDDSLPRSSPEPTDLEMVSNTSTCSDILENVADVTKSDSDTNLNSNTLRNVVFNENYSKLDQNTDSISEGYDCGMEQTAEFQNFLIGVNSTKPRLVVHEDQTCLICKKRIVDEFSFVNRFGLLLNCEHPFCYNCISCCREYRVVSVKCPECSAFSPGIVSSPRWIKSKIKKTELFKRQKFAYVHDLILKLYLNGVYFDMARRGDVRSRSKFTSKSRESKKRFLDANIEGLKRGHTEISSYF